MKKPEWSIIHVVTYVQRRVDVCACARVNAHVCNSELFFSPMEAISECNSVMMIEQCSSDEDTDDNDIYTRSRICLLGNTDSDDSD